MKTYEIKADKMAGKNAFYIREVFPATFLTDNMGKREINKIAKALRQLGHTVIDTIKG